jgi:hypothetical protein
VITVLLVLCSQDLWEKLKQHESKQEPGRVEYRLGPAIDRSGGRIPAAKVDVDLSTDLDFACGRFDLKASFGSLVNKDMAGELLGAALDQLRDRLAGSAMVLACQMSPTLCDALKHFRVTANELLAQKFADCRAIEQQADGPTRTLRARALMACLAEKQRAGVPLDEALLACKSGDAVRGLDGKNGPEVDLVAQLAQAFGLGKESREIVTDLVDAPRLSATGRRGDVKLRSVDAAYERRREEAVTRFRKAVETGKPEGLAPKSLPPVTRADLDLLKSLDEESRRSVVASLARSYALVETAELVHEIEALLEAAAAMTDDPTLREQLARQGERIGRELRRLRDAAEISGAAMESQARALGAARQDRDEKLRRVSASWRSEQLEKVESARMRFPACPDPLCPTKGGMK